MMNSSEVFESVWKELYSVLGRSPTQFEIKTKSGLGPSVVSYHYRKRVKEARLTVLSDPMPTPSRPPIEVARKPQDASPSPKTSTTAEDTQENPDAAAELIQEFVAGAPEEAKNAHEDVHASEPAKEESAKVEPPTETPQDPPSQRVGCAWHECKNTFDAKLVRLYRKRFCGNTCRHKEGGRLRVLRKKRRTQVKKKKKRKKKALVSKGRDNEWSVAGPIDRVFFIGIIGANEASLRRLKREYDRQDELVESLVAQLKEGRTALLEIRKARMAHVRIQEFARGLLSQSAEAKKGS